LKRSLAKPLAEMKKRIIYLLILIFPFLGMITVNEFVRLNTKEEGYKTRGVTAINSANKTKDKCSFICHNETGYCRDNHVKLAKPYFDKIDPLYFGVIQSLKSTGDYRGANILFLVILIPLIMYLLLVKSISMQAEIRKIKKG
tara:strand:+ start:164 stop:592 length:429 start_codon:yes stop_codon:yes gene_type:complete